MSEAKIKNTSHDDSARMGLRGLVRIAGEINAACWPMASFVSNNPLHSLEYLDFEEAVRLGRKKIGGSGYLSNNLYRDYFKSGRILLEDVDLALSDLAQDKHIRIADRSFTQIELLRVQLIHPLDPPKFETTETLLQQASDAETLAGLAETLKATIKAPTIKNCIVAAQKEDSEKLSRHLTLSQWCDASFGTEIVEQINFEMIQWFAAFLDEGQAPWEMPGRTEGFYSAWKKAAVESGNGAGICDIREKISRLSDRSEDAVLESLERLGIPKPAWEDYLSLHLAALPGWTAFAKWRSRQSEYAWQQVYPLELIQILAIRLWYEQEWVSEVCLQEFEPKQDDSQDTIYDVIQQYLEDSPSQYFFRKEQTAGKLPAWLSEEVDLLLYARTARQNKAWDQLAVTYENEAGRDRDQLAQFSAAWRLSALAVSLKIDPESLKGTPTEDLMTLIAWLDDFPEADHGPYWLRAFETGYRRSLIKKLSPEILKKKNQSKTTAPDRPLAQAIFCIDVRSEPFRRQLEQVGHYDTYGFAGFFAAFIRYRAFGSHHDTDLFPVVMEAKHVIHEIPRISDEKHVSRHLAGTKLLHAGHTLFHDLKENVITPYVMVESIGWFFAFPFFGKTFWPVKYAAWVKRLLKRFAPPIATTLTVNKRARTEVEEIIVSEQCVTIRQALRARLGRSVVSVPHNQIEALRKRALHSEQFQGKSKNEVHQKVFNLFKSDTDAEAFITELYERYRITPGWSSARMEQITRTGYTLKEQAFTIETGLRVMGLTDNFAPFVLLCAHGSSNENNPFEAALDCGACAGNPGGPNARIFALMANKPEIRAMLTEKGVIIPEDTWFVAAQHDTTTDEVTILDLKDIPISHNDALSRLKDDLKKAALLNNAERHATLPDFSTGLSPEDAAKNLQKRSQAWNQVRPEWGLSGNAAFIIGHRRLSKEVDLGGRVFLHSYDTEADPEGTKLEIIMTGPQVVTQWISMGYYFSIADNEVYGSGNKIYHNVAGRIGIMSGPTSDLRMGLPWQSVSKGNRPYHEPMRLLVLIEAPRERIDSIITRHLILQRYYHNRWVNLVALEAGCFYQYLPSGEWISIK